MKVKMFYDKRQSGYVAYMPDGTPIPGLKNVTIDDNFDNSLRAEAIAIVKIEVEVVNEEPKKEWV